MDEELQAIEYAEEVNFETFQVRLRGFGVQVKDAKDVLFVADAGIRGEEVDSATTTLGAWPVESGLEHGGAVCPVGDITGVEDVTVCGEGRGDACIGCCVDVGEDDSPGCGWRGKGE